MPMFCSTAWRPVTCASDAILKLLLVVQGPGGDVVWSSVLINKPIAPDPRPSPLLFEFLAMPVDRRRSRTLEIWYRTIGNT